MQDPKTTPHGRTPPAACFSSSLEGRDCATSTALPWWALLGRVDIHPIFGGESPKISWLKNAAEPSRFGAQNVIPNIGGREIPRSKRARSGASHRDSRDREPGVKRQ